MIKQSGHKSENSVVLYGISKVEYGSRWMHAFSHVPEKLRKLSRSGYQPDLLWFLQGAFRLTWDTASWNAGNVDTMHTFDEPEAVYRLGTEALGRDLICWPGRQTHAA